MFSKKEKAVVNLPNSVLTLKSHDKLRAKPAPISIIDNKNKGLAISL